jgi:hypothetical protein
VSLVSGGLCRHETVHRTSSFNLAIFTDNHTHLRGTDTSPSSSKSNVIKMAGHKYQDVPQRDSLDEPQYSQAPPSYDAEASTQAALLAGVPRGEDDNLPDDFKFGGVVAEATLDIRMAFIRKVYSIL